jgi:hypothetical protein
LQVRGDGSNSVGFVVGVHVIARGTDERAAFGGVQFGNLLEERIEMDMGQRGLNRRVEALDEAEDFDLELVGARDRAVNGGVERGVSPPAVRMPMRFIDARCCCCCCSSC